MLWIIVRKAGTSREKRVGRLTGSLTIHYEYSSIQLLLLVALKNGTYSVLYFHYFIIYWKCILIFMLFLLYAIANEYECMACEKEKGHCMRMKQDHKINFNWNWNATLHMNCSCIIQCSSMVADESENIAKIKEKLNKITHTFGTFVEQRGKERKRGKRRI